MIKPETRMKIKGYLEGMINTIIAKHKGKRKAEAPYQLRPIKKHSEDGDIKPFHEALIPDGILAIWEFERSFSTDLGHSFEEVGKLVALDNHSHAERGFPLVGEISGETVSLIEAFENEINNGKVRPGRFIEMVDEVFRSSSNTGRGTKRTVRVDLYVLTSKDERYFFEIKTPQPNKGQCREVTKRLLTVVAIAKGKPPLVNPFYAMAYNPYGTSKAYYKRSISNYLDLENEVVIQQEFWDILGGPGTFEEVLDIYREVGKDKGGDIIDQLALNY